MTVEKTTCMEWKSIGTIYLKSGPRTPFHNYSGHNFNFCSDFVAVMTAFTCCGNDVAVMT